MPRPTPIPPPVQSLTELGFTRLEAEVYVLLLKESPATGYRVAQSLGRTAANVYKTIEALQRRGAVMVDEGRTRQARAVPVAEFLTHLRTRFDEDTREASRLLEELQAESSDDRIYRLKTRDQVINRCRAMLDRAEEFALIDAFPRLLELLRDSLGEAASRGVVVAVLAYTPIEIEGVEVTVAPVERDFIDVWPGQNLTVVIDATEFLDAMLTHNGEEVSEAVWSKNHFLACFRHDGAVSSLIATGLEVALATKGTSVRDLRTRRDGYRRLTMTKTPGFRFLSKHYGSTDGQKGKAPS